MIKRYCEKWDSYFEPQTGKWLEQPCGSTDCPYDCMNRPEKHLKHKWQNIDQSWGICGEKQ